MYLIEILHQTTTKTAATLLSPSCILSKFYIKPQPRSGDRYTQQGCILSKFYIKPQQCCGQVNQYQCCILSKFYIKPQQVIISIIALLVVSYRNSTSNHNTFEYVVNTPQLYLIEILHQTTTLSLAVIRARGCILSKFYIKPQLYAARHSSARSCILSKFYIKPQRQQNPIYLRRRCILSKFYIKPQLIAFYRHLLKVVSYRNSTSNHN